MPVASFAIPARKSLSAQVAEAITRELIADGLKPGDRLPTEPELAEKYEVSRSVIREAARTLVERGLVDIRAGRGMSVAEFNGAGLAKQFELMLELNQGSFENLMEMRIVLEVGMTELAASKRTDADLTRIDQSLAEFAESPDNADALRADLEFHIAVAAASHNPFFEHVINPVNEYLRRIYSESMGYEAARSQTRVEHEQIATAIRAMNPQAASDAAKAHLSRITASGPELTSRVGEAS